MRGSSLASASVRVAFGTHLTQLGYNFFMSQFTQEETKRILVNGKAVDQHDTQKILQNRSNGFDRKRKTSRSGCGCVLVLMFVILLVYLLFPYSTRFLLLGIDRAPQGTLAGRSDTIMLISVDPLRPQVKLFSIPRDLWVSIPGYGENRVNAAHFFAELQQSGTGPQLALQTIRSNFGVDLHYYVRLSLDGLPALIDAMGGIALDLPQPMAGLPAGTNHLDGTQALAFLRSRSDGDDFLRIRQGQLFISAFAKQLLDPYTWLSLPRIVAALPRALDTNLPLWLLPRLFLAFVRASIGGIIETHTIDRSMVTPTLTSEGARILLPDWTIILPYLRENF